MVMLYSTQQGYLLKVLLMLNKKAKIITFSLLTLFTSAFATSSLANDLDTGVIILDSTAPTALTPFNAMYQVSKGRVTLGTVKRQLTQLSDDKYIFSYTSDLSFLILSDKRKESAEIEINNDVIQPLKYQFKREGTGTDSRSNIGFDPISGNVIDLDNRKSLDCSTDVHWLDQISYQLQMKLDIAAGKEEVDYYLVNDDKREKHYQFKVTGREQLTVPAGTFETIKLERIRKNKKRLTEFWVAPELGYLLIRIRQEKDGTEQADAKLQVVTFNDINA